MANNDPFAAYGGRAAYEASQRKRYATAAAAGNQALMSALKKDAQRVGFDVTTSVSQGHPGNTTETDSSNTGGGGSTVVVGGDPLIPNAGQTGGNLMGIGVLVFMLLMVMKLFR